MTAEPILDIAHRSAMSGYDIGFAPLVPWPLILGSLAVVTILLTIAARARLSGAGLRACAAAILFLALANPSLIEEQRHLHSDIALAVVDESPSQDIGDRQRRTQAALAALHSQASQNPDLELRIVRAGREADALTGDAQTRLFAALERARADIPSRRYAGAILITDGQIHDLPAHLRDGPVHALLTGQRGENDRRLTLVQAPAYGLVDRTVTLTLRIDDEGAQPQPIPVTLRLDGDAVEQAAILPNQNSDIAIPLRHGGQNLLEISAPVRNGELTGINNRAAVAINGIRDRLRVLLISGEPYPGERTWRNLLKADPSVDLVHFTILRPPGKQDGTPIAELSLIAFPVRELFEVKLKEFDLIVFDRYRQQNIISQSYLQAIADYVEAGGAVLEVSGAAYASSLSLYRSPLGAVLPGAPTGRVIEQPFRPAVSPLGQRHPVTASLPGANPANAAHPPAWGEWLRQIDIAPISGQAVMTGIDGKPLLLLDRVGRGRIAQLASDHVWLWARGYQGGGPQGELLRRIAHWLMKEPALEEEDLVVLAQGGELSIERRSLSPVEGSVSVTDPHGRRARLPLIAGKASAAATVPGLYRIEDDSRSRTIAFGPLNPKEYSDLRSRDDQLKPLLAESGGGVVWLADLSGPAPDIRRTARGRNHHGRGWIGLVRNRDYDVTGYRRTPLLPGWALLGLALGLIALSWRCEGR